MRLLLAGLLALLLAAAGCGDGDGNGGDGAQTTPSERSTPAETESRSGGEGDGARASRGAAGTFDARALYDRDSPGVVTIYSIFSAGGLEAILGGGEEGGGVGSGFVLNEDGEIATNAHVVAQGEGPELEEAREVYVEFADGNRVEAEIVGTDPFADIALLRVDPDGLDLRPLELGTDDSVEIGEPVAAIGSPFGQRQSLSVGIVSATDRSIQSLTAFQISGAVQTDAAINPGNSGGPLVDLEGRVIGVNQQIRTTSGANEGVGYAVPIDLVKRSVEQLAADGEVRYAYLGVTTQEIYPQLAERFELPVEQGAWIQQVTDGGPASRAGLRGGGRTQRFQAVRVNPGGDIIVRVNDTPIADPDDLSSAINQLAPGDTARLEIRRGDGTRTVEVSLEERPLGDLDRQP